MARPNLSYLKNFALVLTGILVGIWTGLTGMGGALMLTPALVWLIALRDRQLSLVVLTVTTLASLFALLSYGQHHQISWLAAAVFAVANTIGIRIGSTDSFSKLRDSKAAGICWSIAALCVGAWLMFGSTHGALMPLSVHTDRIWSAVSWLAVIVSAILAGLIGRVGNLGGLLSVPFLLLIAGFPALFAQATTLAALVLISAAPTAVIVGKREALTVPTAWTSFGAILGAMTGSRIAVSLPSMRLTLIYGAGMYVVGIVRLFAAWQRPRAQKQAPTV